MALKLGYKASAEQFAPRQLLDFSVEAERHGLELVGVSDHFQPFRHTDGHGPACLPWLGALGERTETGALGTSVLTPTMRYHPSIDRPGVRDARLPEPRPRSGSASAPASR